MYGEALVCKCGKPLFRVYQNPHEVTVEGNWKSINQKYYYICPNCLIPCLQSEQEQTKIDNCIRFAIECEQTDQAVHEFERHLKEIGKKLPPFHTNSCVSNVILIQKFKDSIESFDVENALVIGQKLIENQESVREGTPDKSIAVYYMHLGDVEDHLNHPIKAYKYFCKARDYLTIIFGKTDSQETKPQMEVCEMHIQLIEDEFKRMHIPLN
ncbi:MAG: hypothetical protein EZS28_034420 [Streblomastix strix]|uniref:Uncharacterized protein n=1 Tax=Streblomastix strix TaxID=222440 RepID=A0A5J4UIL5_9EUKA|nr:MAG: hypothetical protein EZS28_034420 [Streblomastix strix]